MTQDKPEIFDVSARKFHQVVSVALLCLGFVLGGSTAIALVTLVGVVMLAGRFWWPADIFRQLAWRVLEPRGILKRYDAIEDHSMRRVARVMGGVIFLVSAALLAADQTWAWALIAPIGVMIALDAAFNYCVLCEISYRFGMMRPSSAGGAH